MPKNLRFIIAVSDEALQRTHMVDAYFRALDAASEASVSAIWLIDADEQEMATILLEMQRVSDVAHADFFVGDCLHVIRQRAP